MTFATTTLAALSIAAIAAVAISIEPAAVGTPTDTPGGRKAGAHDSGRTPRQVHRGPRLRSHQQLGLRLAQSSQPLRRPQSRSR